MMKLLPLLLVLSIFAAVQLAQSAPTSTTVNNSLGTFLSKYVPSATVSSSAFFSQSVGNSSYVVMKSASGKYLVINVTSGRYSILTNASQISTVLKPYLLAIYYPSQSVFTNLSASMHAYINQSSPPLSDCLIETGLNQYTCTAANNCFSCQTVPNCKRVLSAAGGPNGVFALGIMNFSSHYSLLNQSYNGFLSDLSKLNESDFGSEIGSLSTFYRNISSLSAELPRNPIFPLPKNFSPSQFQGCNAYITTEAPWYCVDLGYCQYTTFNGVLLSSIGAQLNSLESLPLSDSAVLNTSKSSASYADSFVQPVITQQLTAQFAAFLNTTYPKYNSTLEEAMFLNARFSNATLSSSIYAIESEFASILNATIHQNITSANSTMLGMLKGLNTLDAKIGAAYMPVYNTSVNNTVLIAKQELNYRTVPYQLAKLAALQESINTQLNSKVNSTQLSSIASSLSGIKSSALGFNPIFSAPALVKGIDGPIASSIMSGSTASVASKLASAPFYAAIISFLIGLIVILAFYSLTYYRLKKKRKIRITHRTRRAWKALFIVLFALLLVYTYATYAYASSANSFLPINQFLGSVRSSNTVIVAANLSNPITSQTLECAVSLNSTLASMGKHVITIGIDNGTCTLGNSTSARCYDELLASQKPIIYLNSLSTYFNGMYGSVFHVSGNFENGSSCYVSRMLQLAK